MHVTEKCCSKCGLYDTLGHSVEEKKSSARGYCRGEPRILFQNAYLGLPIFPAKPF